MTFQLYVYTCLFSINPIITLYISTYIIAIISEHQWSYYELTPERPNNYISIVFVLTHLEFRSALSRKLKIS